MNFKSLIQLLDYFKEEKTCIEYYEKIRWNGNPVCPHCGKDKPYKTNRGYKCSNKDCHKKFTVKVGTIFENSKIPFRVWFAAIYLCSAHKKGISSIQLSVDLNITQKTSSLHIIKDKKTNKVIGIQLELTVIIEKRKEYWFAISPDLKVYGKSKINAKSAEKDLNRAIQNFLDIHVEGGTLEKTLSNFKWSKTNSSYHGIKRVVPISMFCGTGLKSTSQKIAFAR